jgi:SSS family solute:Na+ symporter
VLEPVNTLDKIIVVAYLVIVTLTGFIYSQRLKKRETDEEFLTGGRHMSWWQTGMTLIAQMFDPGIVGPTGLAFTWGLYIVQWNGVNIWITSWFAGMFFVGIYWRTKIITTPEYLEKRFNPMTRGVFSAVMVVMLVSFMCWGVYVGGVLLNDFFGWNYYVSWIILSLVAGFYVLVGGVRTMLFLDVFQGILLLLTVFAVGIMGFVMVGGFPGIKEFTMVNEAGTHLNSLIPPMDFSLFSTVTYPFPTIPTFCVFAGMSWIICNFSMAQRLLASKDESHAQKSLIVAGVFNVFTLLLAYTAGVAMRKLVFQDPAISVEPDKAFIFLMNRFPAGIRGLLVMGMMAALLSTVDGLLAGSSSLLNQDIYKRFIKRNASDRHLKVVARIIQLVIIVIVLLIVPTFLQEGKISQERSGYEILLDFLGSIMGVIIAIYVLGIFFKRTTGKASFIAMLIGIALGFLLDRYGLIFGYIGEKIGRDWSNLPAINFAHIGTIQFLVVLILGYFGSFLEKPKTDVELTNLTVWTVEDAQGPFIGLKSWPGLKWWAIGLPTFWFMMTTAWEIYMRS